MHLSELKDKLYSFDSHGFTPTNVTDVSLSAHGVVVELDESKLERELKDALEELRSLKSDNEDLDALSDALGDELGDELKSARELLEEIKSEDGKKLVDYVRDAELGQASARFQRDRADRCEAETTALRKRKGMDAAHMKYRGEINALLATLEYEGEPRVRALLIKMRLS